MTYAFVDIQMNNKRMPIGMYTLYSVNCILYTLYVYAKV